MAVATVIFHPLGYDGSVWVHANDEELASSGIILGICAVLVLVHRADASSTWLLEG